MLPIFIIACALCGFCLAAFIHIKKKFATPLVCPIGHSCDPVVRSDYSHFMNVPVEILGILYYAFIVFAYTAERFIPALHSPLLSFSLLFLSALAFFFSVYLTSVQAFILREWCTWCLI